MANIDDGHYLALNPVVDDVRIAAEPKGANAKIPDNPKRAVANRLAS
jgi:hypothetical protein